MDILFALDSSLIVNQLLLLVNQDIFISFFFKLLLQYLLTHSLTYSLP